MKIENTFKNYLSPSPNATYGNIIVMSTKNEEDWTWLKKYSDWNVFIDELIINGELEKYGKKDGIPTNENNLKDFDTWIDKDKHLWIVISWNMDRRAKQFIDETKLPMFHFLKMICI